jgi:RecB family exonuclease
VLEERREVNLGSTLEIELTGYADRLDVGGGKRK